MSYNKGYRCVYSLNIHLVLVTKYRKKVIDKAILQRLQEIFANTCEKWSSKLTDFNGEPDHVHLVIDFPPDVEISKLVNNLKTVSSRLIRKEFAIQINKVYFKPVFWTGAYFVASGCNRAEVPSACVAPSGCGGVTIDQIKQYVENQAAIEI